MGQVRLVGDVEEHRAQAAQEGHDVDLDQAEHPQGPGQRQGGEQQPPHQIGDHEDIAAPHAIDPDPGRPSDDEEGQELERGEQPDVERPAPSVLINRSGRWGGSWEAGRAALVADPIICNFWLHIG